MLFENDDKLYTMVDKVSYNYYDIDVNNILLFKKSNNKYIIRSNDLNKMEIIPLPLKIKNVFSELHAFENNSKKMFILNKDKELFKKCREIWNKIIELIGINNTKDFVKNTIDYDADEFITVDDIDANKILVSKNEPYGKNNSLIYFIEYNDNHVIRPLCLKLSKLTGYMSLGLMMNNILKNIIKHGKKLRS